MTRLKRKIRKWLGLGEAFIGVDVGIHDQTCIVICSRLNNGVVRIIDTHFASYLELHSFIKEMQSRFAIRDTDIFWDAPRGWR